MRPRRADAGPRRQRFRAFAVALIALSLEGAPAHAQVPFPTELQTVSRVRFEGRHAVTPRELVAAMKTKPPALWPWREHPRLRRDFLRADTLAIEMLYRQHGFLDARASAVVTSERRNPRRAVITFRITEGRRMRIRAVTFTGTAAVTPEVLRRLVYARPGRAFNPAYLVADTARIADAYQERGHLAHASASAERESLGVTVRYSILEGPLYTVGRVYVSSPGVVRVDSSLVRRELLLREGDAYRKSRVERSLERLYGTGLFGQAQISALPDSARRVIDFDLRVVERKPRWLDAGVGSGSAERFRFTGEWGHRNLAGQGLNGVLGSRVAFDDRGKFLLTRTTASLVQPWLFGTRTRGGISLYFERRDDRADDRWIVGQDAKGIAFQAYRELGRRGRISITQDNVFVMQHVTFDLQRLRNAGVVLPDTTLDSLFAAVKPSYATHRLTLSGLRDRRDDPLMATRGSAQVLSAEIAGGPLQGASSFTKGVLASSWYTPFANGWVLATRASGGAIRPFGKDRRFTPGLGIDPEVARVPLENRFRIGGVNSVRGFRENELTPSGGLAMALAGAELRVPVAGPFGIEVFVDTGNVWAQPGHVKWKHFVPSRGRSVPDPGDLRTVFGAGGTLLLPFGPLRVDLAWSARPVGADAAGRPVWLVCEPQFAIGPSF